MIYFWAVTSVLSLEILWKLRGLLFFNVLQALFNLEENSSVKNALDSQRNYVMELWCKGFLSSLCCLGLMFLLEAVVCFDKVDFASPQLQNRSEFVTELSRLSTWISFSRKLGGRL